MSEPETYGNRLSSLGRQRNGWAVASAVAVVAAAVLTWEIAPIAGIAALAGSLLSGVMAWKKSHDKNVLEEAAITRADAAQDVSSPAQERAVSVAPEYPAQERPPEYWQNREALPSTQQAVAVEGGMNRG